MTVSAPRNSEINRFSDALKVPERELLERFLLDTGQGLVNPIDAHGIIGHAIGTVATEHERTGDAALYQPGQDYTSRELVDMIAKTIFKPKFYEAFKERLDAMPDQQPSFVARENARRGGDKTNQIG